MEETLFERFVRGEISENQYLGKKEEGVFHKGDRVVGVASHDGVNLRGMTGTVHRAQGNILVHWDKTNPNFHTGDGDLPKNSAYWVYAEKIKHA